MGRRPSAAATPPAPPTASLPSLRNPDSLTEACVVAAVDGLVALYCPLSDSVLALGTTTNSHDGDDDGTKEYAGATSSSSASGSGSATPSLLAPPTVDSGYASGVEDEEDTRHDGRGTSKKGAMTASAAAAATTSAAAAVANATILLGASQQHQASLAALRADQFERAFAERWLTTFLARSEEICFDSDDLRQELVDKAACVLASFHSALDDDQDDEGVVRNLTFPLSSSASIEVQLNDGALSSTDHTDVGLQSWGASIVFSELVCATPERFGIGAEQLGPAPQIVELGAGTGLVSLAMAKLLPLLGVPEATVVATDHHAAVLDNLRVNIVSNFPAGATATAGETSAISACALDWSAPCFAPPLDKPSDMLVATDVVYAPEHAIWLRDCAARMLKADGVFWLMATVRRAGKFEGISDTVQAAFAAGGCPTLSAAVCGGGEERQDRVLRILEEQTLERPRGVGHGDESGYKLFRIGWA